MEERALEPRLRPLPAGRVTPCAENPLRFDCGACWVDDPERCEGRFDPLSRDLAAELVWSRRHERRANDLAAREVEQALVALFEEADPAPTAPVLEARLAAAGVTAGGPPVANVLRNSPRFRSRGDRHWALVAGVGPGPPLAPLCDHRAFTAGRALAHELRATQPIDVESQRPLFVELQALRLHLDRLGPSPQPEATLALAAPVFERAGTGEPRRRVARVASGIVANDQSLPFSSEDLSLLVLAALAVMPDGLPDDVAAGHADLTARLVEANLALATNLARTARATWRVPFADRLQAARMGMLEALGRYDVYRGARFATFATWWMRHHIDRSVLDNERVVRVPIHANEALRAAGIVEDGVLVGEPQGEAIQHAAQAALEPLSIEEMIEALDEADPGDEGPTPPDVIDTRYDPDEIASRRAIRESIAEALGVLIERQQFVLRMRYGMRPFDREHTLQEIGDRLEVTRERVRQVETSALRQLRRPTVSNALYDYRDSPLRYARPVPRPLSPLADLWRRQPWGLGRPDPSVHVRLSPRSPTALPLGLRWPAPG